jgi:predicted acetyltransferase
VTDITVSPPVDQAELEAFVPIHRRTYFMSPEDGQAWADWVPRSNVRIARRGDRMVGGASLVPMGQWFGGRTVQMTGISAVGIEPAERATGAGTVLMKEILVELNRLRVPLSSLYPATQTVYRRCGYELAGNHIRYRLQTDHADTRDRSLQIELTEDREQVKRVYDEYARRTAGLLDRSEDMWKRVFEPYKQEATQAYVVIGNDGPEGYVVYHRTTGEGVRQHMYANTIALTPAAARRILTFVADHRSFAQTFNWTGPPADPFTFALSEPRREVQMSWPWMMRIVDVEIALRERGYPVGLSAELHLKVSDDLLPSNDGDFVLRVADGKCEIERGGQGSMSIDIRGLASLYTGYTSAHELLSTGYVDGPDSDLAKASAIFAGPAPWLADFF